MGCTLVCLESGTGSKRALRSSVLQWNGEGSGGGSRCAKNGLGLAFNPFKVMQHPSLLLLRLASTFSYLEKELI